MDLRKPVQPVSHRYFACLGVEIEFWNYFTQQEAACGKAVKVTDPTKYSVVT